MNSHNTKVDFSFHKTPLADKSAEIEADTISAKLITGTGLAIDDAIDNGGDPYNTTGQHVILRQKQINGAKTL